MNSPRRRCYGVLKISSSLAQRLRRDWDGIEMLADSRRGDPWAGARSGAIAVGRGKEKRPLAA